MHWLLTERQVQPSTARNYVSQVRTAMGTAYGWKYALTPLYTQFMKRLSQIPPRVRKHRAPLTRPMLEAAYAASDLFSLGVRTVCVLGFFV